VAKVYADVNERMGKEYYDYESYKIKWSSTERCENYSIIKKIGRGKYSEVFEGHDSLNDTKIVIKILKPVRVTKIRREIKILDTLRGGPNIVKLTGVCKSVPPAFGALIFEHIDHVENVKRTMLFFTDYEIRYFMYQLVKALDYCHSKGIIHRDVKPQNLVIDRKNKRLRLIDWGLADFYHKHQIYNVRVASRHYKSPELLVRMQMYDYSVDLFAFGLTLLGMVSQKIPFFRGEDNVDQLYKIADVLGTVDLKKYISKYKLKPSKDFNKLLEKHTPRLSLKQYHKRHNNFATGGLYNLLGSVLRYDHQERLTARQCMEHTYFKQIHMEELAQHAEMERKSEVSEVSNHKVNEGDTSMDESQVGVNL